MQEVINGMTPSGKLVVVRMDSRNMKMVECEIDGEQVPITLFRHNRDGGSFSFQTPHGVLSDARARLPRDPGRLPTLDGEPIAPLSEVM